MPFFQPPVTPPPEDMNLNGKTIIITGANQGLGYETARQFLKLKASTVILAVRNIEKGEKARSTLLSDPAVKKENPNAVVKVMKVDLEVFQSVLEFAAQVKKELAVLDVLLLNAGVNWIFKHEATTDNHERVMQVNYLSNALLTLELLPLLVSSAEKSGSPSHLSWVGSRMHLSTSLSKKQPLGANESVIGHFDDPKKFHGFSVYGDSKLLCAMFLEDLAARVPSDKVIINSMCPGMVDTNSTVVLPFYLKAPVYVVKKLYARTPWAGSWVIVNAAVVAGKESHGKSLEDKDIVPHSKYIDTPAGQESKAKLWGETMEEMVKIDETLRDVLPSSLH